MVALRRRLRGARRGAATVPPPRSNCDL